MRGKDGREELLGADCSPHSPPHRAPRGGGGRGVGTEGGKLSLERRVGGKGVFTFVSHHPTLLLIGDKQNFPEWSPFGP